MGHCRMAFFVYAGCNHLQFKKLCMHTTILECNKYNIPCEFVAPEKCEIKLKEINNIYNKKISEETTMENLDKYIENIKKDCQIRIETLRDGKTLYTAYVNGHSIGNRLPLPKISIDFGRATQYEKRSDAQELLDVCIDEYEKSVIETSFIDAY